MSSQSSSCSQINDISIVAAHTTSCRVKEVPWLRWPVVGWLVMASLIAVEMAPAGGEVLLSWGRAPSVRAGFGAAGLNRVAGGPGLDSGDIVAHRGVRAGDASLGAPNIQRSVHGSRSGL